MGEYSKSAIIKYTRKSLGITQEELSESVCDPVTLSKYEMTLEGPYDFIFMDAAKGQYIHFSVGNKSFGSRR